MASNGLEDEAKKYTASYSGFVSDDRWYIYKNDNLTSLYDLKRIPDPPRVRVLGFSFIRAIEVDERPEEALRVTFDIQVSSDGSAFRVVPKTAKLFYARAKVPTVHYYLPWTLLSSNDEDSIDLDLAVDIHATWIDDKQKSHSEMVSSLSVPIRNLKIQRGRTDSPVEIKDVSSPWCGNVPRSVVAVAEGRLNDQAAKWPILGNGNFTINVSATESNGAGARLRQAATLVSDNEQKLADRVKSELGK